VGENTERWQNGKRILAEIGGRQTHTRRNRCNKVHNRERKSQRREREGGGGGGGPREREREAMHRESEDGKRILAEIDAMGGMRDSR
jgi:hypothetical protein